jgi:sugar lactone lactonase YvrE
MNRHVTFCALLVFIQSLGASPIATYPPGTILENIAISATGDLFVTDVGSGTIFRISPGWSTAVFAQAPVALAGVAFDTDGTLVAAGESSFYRFAADGTPTLVADIPGAGFLNGVTLLSPGKFLVADDTADLVWQVNLSTGSASPWLTSSLLVPTDSTLPIGPNGVKLFGGSAYISVTGSGTILRVPIASDGSAGSPQVYASSLQVDDFAFGSDGSIFVATQTGNSVIRIRPNGTRTTIATEADGLLGDAALAFGRTAVDSKDIYVVNNGGAFSGDPNGPQAATVVRLATDTTGVVPEAQAIPEPASLALSAAGAGLVLVLRKRRTRFPKYPRAVAQL